MPSPGHLCCRGHAALPRRPEAFKGAGVTLYVDHDYETRSACDLKACGAWRYSEDATTEILCLHFAFTDPHTHYCWLPGTEDQLAASVLSHLAEGDAIFVAHNAGFEQAIWANIMVKVHGF